MEDDLGKGKFDLRLDKEWLTVDDLRGRVFGDELFPEPNIVEDFFTKLKFFPPRIETTGRILRLNQELSDSYIEEELSALSQTEPMLLEAEEIKVNGGWVNSIMRQVSAILFHEDETAEEEQPALSQRELISFFQKTLSERIYNHLSMLSRSPHAKKGRPFSIKEELTEQIAAKIGLGLYLQPEIPVHLCAEADNTLLDLAWEFQQWLQERGGQYTATWGDICSVEAKSDMAESASHARVLMIPDVERRTEENQQAPWFMTRRGKAAAKREEQNRAAAAAGEDV